MTLATVAFRLTSDTDFAAQLKEHPDQAVAKIGDELSDDEKKVLHFISQIPGNVSHLIDTIVLAEPWATCG